MRPPPSSYKPTQSRGGTTAAGRPISNRGMNFTSDLAKKAKQLQGAKYREELGKKTNSQQQVARALEKQVHSLVDECTSMRVKGSHMQAVEKAKEGIAKQKILRKAREGVEGAKPLTALVTLNQALCLQSAGMMQEALGKYNELIKTKQFELAGRFRVNMGNIYFAQQKYVSAIRMYKMAMDVLPNTSKEMRLKITRNIGHAHVRLGDHVQAIGCYQAALKGSPDHRTAFNLLLCLYETGDKLRMKDCFSSLISQGQEEEEPAQEALLTADRLREDAKAKRKEELRVIVLAARLMAPVIDNNIIESYNWILEKVKASNYPQVQSQVEIFKAMAYLKGRQIELAIETLKGLQRKDKATMSRVASNISFLYFLEGDYAQAQKYVDIAIRHDRYNARALVNKGNCLFTRNDFAMAKNSYLQAVGVQADCVEALYNLGYVNKRLNLFAQALHALQKIQNIIALPQTMFQIASIHQMAGRTKQALKWYQLILTKVPQDAGVLARVGNIFFREDDEAQALHYYLQSYRLLPTDTDTNTWLGIYYVKQSAYEKACHHLERVSQILPREVKWRLMVASCQRRIGNFQKALKIYQSIYQQNPDNLECLRFLVLLCKDMGLDYELYAKELKRVEMMQEAREDYNDDNLKDINQEEEEAVAAPAKTDKRRLQREVKPQAKKDDQWGADDQDLNVGI